MSFCRSLIVCAILGLQWRDSNMVVVKDAIKEWIMNDCLEKWKFCDYFDFFSEDSQIILNVERIQGMRRGNAFGDSKWVYWRGDEE